MLSKEEFAHRLKTAIAQKGLKQAELAEMVGTTAANMSNYVREKSFPPVDTLVEIAKNLDVSLDWLCGMDRKEAKLEEPKTYGDFARIILAIIYNEDISSQISTAHIKTLRSYANYPSYCEKPYDEEDVPCIAFTSGPIRTLIEDMVKLQGMLAQGTLSNDFYERWLDDRIKALSDNPIKLEDFADDEECMELPF